MLDLTGTRCCQLKKKSYWAGLVCGPPEAAHRTNRLGFWELSWAHPGFKVFQMEPQLTLSKYHTRKDEAQDLWVHSETRRFAATKSSDMLGLGEELNLKLTLIGESQHVKTFGHTHTVNQSLCDNYSSLEKYLSWNHEEKNRIRFELV